MSVSATPLLRSFSAPDTSAGATGDDLETRAHHGRVIINSRGLGAERAEPLAVLGARPEAFVTLAPLGDVLVALPLAEGVGRSDLGERDDVDVNDSDHARGRPGGVEDELSVTGRRQPSPGIGLVVGQQGRRRSFAARQDRRREPIAQRTGERGLPAGSSSHPAGSQVARGPRLRVERKSTVVVS